MNSRIIQKVKEEYREKAWSKIKRGDGGEVEKCEICGRSNNEVKINYEVWTVEVYYLECSECGNEIEKRVSDQTGNKNLYTSDEDGGLPRCSECGNKVLNIRRYPKGSTAERGDHVLNKLSADEILEICIGPVPDLRHYVRTIEHHYSYVPEQTMVVCRRCHKEIHYDDQYTSLEPSLTRPEWLYYKSEANKFS